MTISINLSILSTHVHLFIHTHARAQVKTHTHTHLLTPGPPPAVVVPSPWPSFPALCASPSPTLSKGSPLCRDAETPDVCAPDDAALRRPCRWRADVDEVVAVAGPKRPPPTAYSSGNSLGCVRLYSSRLRIRRCAAASFFSEARASLSAVSSERRRVVLMSRNSSYASRSLLDCVGRSGAVLQNSKSARYIHAYTRTRTCMCIHTHTHTHTHTHNHTNSHILFMMAKEDAPVYRDTPALSSHCT